MGRSWEARIFSSEMVRGSSETVRSSSETVRSSSEGVWSFLKREIFLSEDDQGLSERGITLYGEGRGLLEEEIFALRDNGVLLYVGQADARMWATSHGLHRIDADHGHVDRKKLLDVGRISDACPIVDRSGS